MTEDEASYDWKRGAIGLSADIGACNERLRWLFDIGYGVLENDSESQQGRYQASQDDTFVYVVSHIEEQGKTGTPPSRNMEGFLR